MLQNWADGDLSAGEEKQKWAKYIKARLPSSSQRLTRIRPRDQRKDSSRIEEPPPSAVSMPQINI